EESHQSESPRISGVSQPDGEKDIEAQATEVTQRDENVVWWDEPVEQDPDNPMNWGAGRKWGTIAILAFITFITPLAFSYFCACRSAGNDRFQQLQRTACRVCRLNLHSRLCLWTFDHCTSLRDLWSRSALHFLQYPLHRLLRRMRSQQKHGHLGRFPVSA